MARIRSIKPEMFTRDRAFGRSSRDARLLFVGLITQADDAGRQEGDPAVIASAIFPYDRHLATEDVEAWLAELAAVELIVRYEVDGDPYISLTGWHNQKIDRPTPTKHPAPPGDEPTADLADGTHAFVDSIVADAARALFDYWRERCGHPQAKLTDDRRRKLRARLQEGYTHEQIREAIDGAAVGAFVNDDGHRFDDLELICRTGSKLESFMARAQVGDDGFDLLDETEERLRRAEG